MTVSLHYVSKSITAYSAIKYLTRYIQVISHVFPHKINFTLSCITTTFLVIQNGMFSNKLQKF